MGSKSLALGALVAAASPALGQSFTIDGQTVALQPFGVPSAMEITAGAGEAIAIFGDVNPGPTTVFSQSVDLGFTKSIFLVHVDVTDGAGELSVPFTLASQPSMIGFQLYLAAAATDPLVPSGVTFTNGVELVFFPGEVIETQLAGNSLATYPHFEFVTSFNADATIEVGVDPLLQAHAAGRTADVYVTLDKSQAEWELDPSLNDVTLDDFESVTFGTDLASSRFTVDVGTLNALAGTDVGVGYDMVVDMNRNGVLDAGDLIDGLGEAGLYAVHDLTKSGPYAVEEGIYSGGSFLGQDVYYPANIGSLGELPLVIVSHGNGHNYQWYDHIGEHMASYGYIVMSHQNNTGPGIEAASTTTLTNTDYFLGNLDIIEGGALEGHVDSSKMIWIGHSRGGEGVARAYDRIFDGDWIPVEYTLDDIVLVSSIAPTDFLGTSSATSHAANYHLWVGGSDNDVSGCSSSNITQSFHLHDRAENQRQSISLHGVGHGDFHDGGGSSVATGPCLMGRARTHRIMQGYMLPLFDYHVTGNPASKDFLWRQWESFRPGGAPAAGCTVVDLQFREGVETGKLVIDDFQSNPSEGLASSEAVVTHDLDEFSEGRFDDGTSSFTDLASDPFNGFTGGSASDSTAGIVFEFDNVDRSLVYELEPADRDWSGLGFLSFRAAQATRDVLTNDALEDLTFEVALEDGSGNRSTVWIGAWGGGIEEPYQRTGCGTGTGWANEFETIRIRVADLRHDGTGLDLADIERLEFLFGPSHGSPSGRIGIDDIEVTAN